MNSQTVMDETVASSADFDRLFNPRSIAVVGASVNPEAIGGQPIKHLLDHGYTGAIYPVNPKYETVSGLACYRDISALPQAPDVLVIAVAARFVAELITLAGQKGIPFVIVFSSGFAETGEDGQIAQAALHETAKAAGVTLIGPNCQGLINISDDIPIGFGGPYAQRYGPGTVSVSSQSGAFGNSLLMGLDEENVGLRHYISTGNEAATTSLDCMEFFLDDPETKVVAGYVEGFQDAYRLRQLGDKALRANKPMVLWKVGNTTAGAKAASSHTANLAGESTYYEAAFKQFGIVGATDIGDMADCIRALLTGRRPQGPGVAVISISGGAGIAMADRCSEVGLELPELASQTVDRLAPLLPSFASLANPVDVTAGALASPESFGGALRVVIEDPAIEMLGLCLAALAGEAASQVAREIARVAADYDTPILVAWNPVKGTADEAGRILDEAGIPCYSSPVRCARGFGALAHFSDAQRRRRQTDTRLPPPLPHPAPNTAQALNEYASKQLLARFGLPVTREKVAHTPDQAVSLAHSIGFPVVMKILSRDIPHKSDAGGVRVGLGDASQVRTAFDQLAALPGTLGGDVIFEGVLIQEMIGDGSEVILGAVNDPSFGPVVMFGAGGIYAEVFEDVTFRLAPLSREDAQAMVDETRISRILRGARGRPEGDLKALVEAIMRLSELAVSEANRFTEIDINPLFVLPRGRGVKVVDAYVKTS